MQTTEFVTWDSSIHVVFSVVIHVPVEELNDGIEVNGATAEAEVRHFVLKADVLCRVAQILEPGTKHFGESDYERYDPVSQRESRASNEEVTDQHNTFPICISAASLGIAFGEEVTGPRVIGVDVACKAFEFALEKTFGIFVVYNAAFPEAFEIKGGR